MAEALAALGLAANIAQFVDYSMKLISESQVIYNCTRGATEGDRELEIVAQDLKCLGDNITKAALQAGQRNMYSLADDGAVHDLAISSGEIANRLLEKIQELRIPDDTRHRKLASLWMAFRGLRKRPEMLELEKRLDRMQRQLGTRMAAALSNKQSTIYSAIEDLIQKSDHISMETTNKLDQLKSELILMANSQTHNAGDTNASLNQFSTMIYALAEECKVVEKEKKILESLCFKEMKERLSDIKEAHVNTLEWVYERQDIMFMNWLELQDGIYWISGKAGSGKSTLMKFIFKHERTMKALQNWAGSTRLIAANYFFWNAGLPMQKSQEGLLQTLLYQILKQCPALIPLICPARWQAADSGISETWTCEELSGTFKQMAQQTALSTKFCFFIDGLDEYSGDEADIIEAINHLTACANVKVCVSSRPWNAFVNKFGESDRKLTMQDLTKNDMRKYVKNMLAKKPLFTKYALRDQRYSSLVSQVVDKAQGVWLWVYLVVRSLSRGLEGYDEFKHLQKRLDEFPADLGQYFNHILAKIETIYREEAAQIFLIAIQAVRPLPLITLHFFQQETQYPNYSLERAIRPFPSNVPSDSHQTWQDDPPDIHEIWQKRLNSRCKDLLEVNISSSESPALLDYRIDFLHRSVRDFLMEKGIQENLRKDIVAQFDPRLSLIKMLIAVLKALPLPEGFPSQASTILELVDEIMHYAKEIEIFHSRSEVSLLDELDSTISRHAKGAKNHWTNVRDAPRETIEPFQEYGHNNFLAFAIQARLQLYVTEKLDKNPKLMEQKRGRPLLDYALRPKRMTPTSMKYHPDQLNANLEIEMVSALLDRGANPNQKVYIYGGQTVWGLFLLACYRASRSSKKKIPSAVQNARYKAAQLLLINGADPNIKLKGTTHDSLTVSDIFRTAFSENLDQLERLLREQRYKSQSFSANIFLWIKRTTVGI